MAKHPDGIHGLTRGMRARYDETKDGRPAMSAYDGRYRPVLPAEAARAELERLRSGRGGQADPDYMLRDTVPMAAMAAAPARYAAMTGLSLPAAEALMAAPVVTGSAGGLARDVKRGVPLHESRYLLPVAMAAAAGTRLAGREVAGNLRHITGGGPRAILPVGPNGMGNVVRAGLSTAELEATASRFPGENVDMHFVRPALTAEGRAMLDADATLVDRMYAALARRRAPHATVGRLLKGRDAKVLAAAYPRTVGRTRVDVRPRAADGLLGEVLPRGRGQSIVLYRDDPPGRSMAPTFGHEFKHVLETQEPFASGGAGSRSNPVVKRLAEDAVALASAEERGAAYGRALKNMAYATSTGENTARAVGLMNETGSLSWRDLLRNPRKHIDFGNGGTVMIDTKDNPGYPVYVSGADLQPATSRYRGPVPPDQLDDKGGKGGDRFSMSRNFLATDKVPDTIFGIPVISRKEDYTEADLRFFEEHPEAGGYYDLGEDEEGTPEDGTMEGAPVQADVPKRIVRRKFAMKFEQPLVWKSVDGNDYVYPKKDKDGQITAGGYRYFLSESDNTLKKHTTLGRMRWDQWAKAADLQDEEFTQKSSDTSKAWGVRNDGAVGDVLWDLAFNMGTDKYVETMSDSVSKSLAAKRAKYAKAYGAETGTAVALLSEILTYGENKRRKMARADLLLNELRESVAGRSFAMAFDGGARGVPRDRKLTAEDMDYRRYEAGVAALDRQLGDEGKPATKETR